MGIEPRGARMHCLDAGEVLARDIRVQNHLHAGRRQARPFGPIGLHIVQPARDIELLQQYRGKAGGCDRQESVRSEEHTSELQSLMRISYAVFCLKKKNNKIEQTTEDNIDYRT